ncbi:heavy-metal-associated domain-containing protein [Pontibacterium sp.]|uniref:heavy-metal-associated domain-containing protein n=1 Tax=Pontibacterium sp. TaxID=2036026 RepID=UPI003565D7D1
MMIKYISLTLLALLLSAPVFASPVVYQANVDGLACPFCVYGIEKKLSQLDGVEKIESDLKTGELRIRMQEGKTLTEAEVRAAVKLSGFSLRSFNQTETEPEQ